MLLMLHTRVKPSTPRPSHTAHLLPRTNLLDTRDDGGARQVSIMAVTLSHSRVLFIVFISYFVDQNKHSGSYNSHHRNTIGK